MSEHCCRRKRKFVDLKCVLEYVFTLQLKTIAHCINLVYNLLNTHSGLG